MWPRVPRVKALHLSSRFHKASRLCEEGGAMLSNCVFSLWDLYGKYLIAFIGFFLVQTLLIVSLLMQKRRSRLAEEALKGRLLHLEDLVRERTEVLDNQREWLQITLTSIGDAVIATDMKGRITFINPVAAELTGWREDEALGRTIEEVFRLSTSRRENQPRISPGGFCVTAMLPPWRITRP